MRLTLGCDPEVFVKTDPYKYGVAYDKIPGSKKKPHKISDFTAVHPDNVTLEFNTLKPYDYDDGGVDGFFAHVKKSVDEATAFAKEAGFWDITIWPTVLFQEWQLNNPKAMEVGCDPDLNAHKFGAQNPIKPLDENRRHAGGHIHFGYDVDKVNIPKYCLVQLCDFAALVHDSLGDFAGEDRALTYGKLGSYRDKSYGFEYRTPSNKWLSPRYPHCKNAAKRVIDTVRWAINNRDTAEKLYDAIDFTKFGAESYKQTRLVNLYNKYIAEKKT